MRFSWHGASCPREIWRFSTVSLPEVQKKRGADVDFQAVWAHVSNHQHQVSPRGASDWWRESVRKSVSVHQDKIRGSAISRASGGMSRGWNPGGRTVVRACAAWTFTCLRLECLVRGVVSWRRESPGGARVRAVRSYMSCLCTSHPETVRVLIPATRTTSQLHLPSPAPEHLPHPASFPLYARLPWTSSAPSSAAMPASRPPRR